MKIGKYSVTTSGQQMQAGGFEPMASILWDEGDTTCEKVVHFHTIQKSELGAQHYAMERMQKQYAETGLL